MNRMLRVCLSVGSAAALWMAAAVDAPAQAPKLVNAKAETRAAATDFPAQLSAIVRSAPAAEWIGYSAPSVAGEHDMCCGDWHDGEMSGCGTYRLENEDSGISIHTGAPNDAASAREVKLEGPRQFVVMLRAEGGKAERVRAFSEECELDAGGLPVIWLTGVSASGSVAALIPFAEASDSWDGDEYGDRGVANGALAAIAMTADTSADRAMANFVAPNQPERLRGRAVFWLGAARGHAGYELLQKLARGDGSEDVRSKVAFGLYVSKDSAATDEMIRMAKNDESAHVREQALFWIAQKAGQKAAATITSAIENDPDTEVKKRAVFALSQLPKDQGVPLLIQVAKTNANPAVRKQAMFWLGQSNDPRALQFFEEILGR